MPVPAAAQDGVKPVKISEVAACGDPMAKPDCVLRVLAQLHPSFEALVALATDRELVSDGVHTPTAAFVAATMADRRGQPPALALKPVDDLPPTDRAKGLVSICTAFTLHAPADGGALYLAAVQRLRPSRRLTLEAAARLDAILRSGSQADRTQLAFQALACRAALRDAPGMDADFAIAPPMPDRMRLLMLTSAHRFDDALAFAAKAKAERAGDAVGAAVEFSFVQRERQRLGQAGADFNRPDIARQAALLVLESALGPQRPESEVMDTAVPQALALLTSRPDYRGLAIGWVERLEAEVLPGKQTWNYEDAVAVGLAEIKLGRRTQARAYLDALIARRKDAGQGGGYPIEVLTAALGDWETASRHEVKAADVFYEDQRAGLAAAALPDRLAHAVDADDRARMLRECAAPPGVHDLISLDIRTSEELPLPVAAQCVRDLAAMGRPSVRDERMGGQADSWSDLNKAALVVAERALQRDQVVVTREMLDLLVPLWRRPEAAGQALDYTTATTFLEIALVGKQMPKASAP